MLTGVWTSEQNDFCFCQYCASFIEHLLYTDRGNKDDQKARILNFINLCILGETLTSQLSKTMTAKESKYQKAGVLTMLGYPWSRWGGTKQESKQEIVPKNEHLATVVIQYQGVSPKHIDICNNIEWTQQISFMNLYATIISIEKKRTRGQTK